MEENIAFATKPNTSIISSDVVTTEIIEEGPRVCPLCSSEIRFFFINFTEKMLMCENIECEFPFGYEDLQFMRLDNEDDMSDVVSVRTKPSLVSPMPTGSVISTAAWSEIDKINRVYDSEDSQLEHRTLEMPPKRERKKTKKVKDSEISIQKNVEDIKGLNMELMEISSEPTEIIKNEKWIKNLMSLQGKSDLNLLKREELDQLKKDKKELKIDIDTGNVNSISSISIQIADNSGE